MMSVTFDRAALSLSPLVVSSDPFAGDFWLPEDGVGEVAQALRRSYAPESSWVGGQSLLAAVREASSLPLGIYVRTTTTAALATARATLEAAVGQWSYTLTLTVDGVSRQFLAEPEIPQWSAPDSGLVAAHMDRASLVVPVSPK